MLVQINWESENVQFKEISDLQIWPHAITIDGNDVSKKDIKAIYILTNTTSEDILAYKKEEDD